MLRLHVLIAAIILVAVSSYVAAAPGGFTGSSGGARSSGNAGRTVSQPATRFRPASTPPSRNSGALARRSLIPASGPRPSAKVQEVIREKERSGPGWLGTAFLVTLLSQHDLSSSDRRWVQGQIATLEAEDVGALVHQAGVVYPAVRFTFSGLDGVLAEGVPAKVRVTAIKRDGQRAPVACEFPGGAKKATGQGAYVWTPDGLGVVLIECAAAGQSERRLVNVSQNTNKGVGQ